jgi:hypothetical protein
LARYYFEWGIASTRHWSSRRCSTGPFTARSRWGCNTDSWDFAPGHGGHGAVERVSPGLGRAGPRRRAGLAVIQPVDVAGGTAPSHIVSRETLIPGRHAIGKSARRPAPRNTAGSLASHGQVSVVQPVGVRRRHGVEEHTLLGRGDVILAKQVCVLNRTVMLGPNRKLKPGQIKIGSLDKFTVRTKRQATRRSS